MTFCLRELMPWLRSDNGSISDTSQAECFRGRGRNCETGGSLRDNQAEAGPASPPSRFIAGHKHLIVLQLLRSRRFGQLQAPKSFFQFHLALPSLRAQTGYECRNISCALDASCGRSLDEVQGKYLLEAVRHRWWTFSKIRARFSVRTGSKVSVPFLLRKVPISDATSAVEPVLEVHVPENDRIIFADRS